MELAKLIISIISLAFQLGKLVSKDSESTIKQKIDKMVEMKHALQKMEEGDSNDLEKMFTIIRPLDPKHDSDRMQNDKNRKMDT